MIDPPLRKDGEEMVAPGRIEQSRRARGAARGPRGRLASGVASLARLVADFGPRQWMAAVLAFVAAAVVIGVPTAILPTPWFSRMVEVRAHDYAIWAASAVLLGLVVATYVGDGRRTHESRAVAGGLFSFLAVGCPTCNKLAVVLLGSGGALSIFAPLQIVLGLASVAVLLWTLVLRADAVRGACEPAGYGESAPGYAD